MGKQHVNDAMHQRTMESNSSAEGALDQLDLTYDQDDSIEVTERKMHIACSKLVENPKHHEAKVYFQRLLAGFRDPPVRAFQEAIKNLDSITDKAWKDVQRELKFFLRNQKT